MKLYVGNLPWQTTGDDLSSLFSNYGNVTDAAVLSDRETGRSRGFGFVTMDDEGGKKAIEALDGADFEGRALKVNEARPREDRAPRGGGGGGGGYGNNRY